MGTINALAEKTGAKVIAADATNVEDLNQLIDQSQEIFGESSILYFILLECQSVLKRKAVYRFKSRLDG